MNSIGFSFEQLQYFARYFLFHCFHQSFDLYEHNWLPQCLELIPSIRQRMASVSHLPSKTSPGQSSKPCPSLFKNSTDVMRIECGSHVGLSQYKYRTRETLLLCFLQAFLSEHSQNIYISAPSHMIQAQYSYSAQSVQVL
ncbi:unnamed protein product [Chondrus crispus]|uniref:Uncharacterized protein n=1 Tax=Chondrus crispus TaxID=2769 RepID=R7Q479_CHOCR|nr:unnamed protein product [Chondrus crispus]CDF32678.1 unnamed protein product [Chondrus crispus]|eukprot:XP_005712449.1 unnamed protein product [Chondrus crispus]